MPGRKRETPKKKVMTSAERQAKWRLSHSKVNDVLSPPTLLLACHPTGQIDLDELEESAAKTMELYNKLASCRTCTCASSKVQFGVRRRRSSFGSHFGLSNQPTR